jgi:hypothetical protein
MTMNQRVVARALALAAVLMLLVAPATAELIRIPHGYHFQQTPYYCGIASIQMMLDTPAVRNNNAAIDAYFTANAGNDVLIQNQIYLASRQRRTAFYPVGYNPGTDPVVFSYTINAYDGIANGPALPGGVAQGGNPNHVYGWYGFAPNIYAADQASRTVAYALKNYEVPATVAVGHGAHWVVVDGVQTTGTIPTPANPNAQFNILGFRVSDPWTGHAIANGSANWGMGIHAWYRYGFNAAAFVTEENPDGFRRRGAWYNYFNPVSPGPHPFSGQFNIIVEPDPEPTPPFDPDDGEYSSQPDPYDVLSTAVTAATAYDYSQDALTGDFSFLAQEFSGGTWDTGNITMFSFPDDPAGVGDWLIPYIGPGGSDDVLGAIMIDSLSGTVNQAMWMGGSGLSFEYDQLVDYYSMLYDLDLPESIQAPEPGSFAMLVIAGTGVVLVRRRRATH